MRDDNTQKMALDCLTRALAMDCHQGDAAQVVKQAAIFLEFVTGQNASEAGAVAPCPAVVK